jgi:hypothetical protein
MRCCSIRWKSCGHFLQSLGARRLGQSCLTLSCQFEEHAQTVIETFLVVALFPFLESALPRLALSAKRLCYALVKPASRLGGPLNPHRRDIRPASLEKPIAFQDASISTLKQCCFSRHVRSPLCGRCDIVGYDDLSHSFISPPYTVLHKKSLHRKRDKP